MCPAPGYHTLHQTFPATTDTTVLFGVGGFVAWDHTWTYNTLLDRYESEIGWLVFEGQPPGQKPFAGVVSGSGCGGWWN